MGLTLSLKYVSLGVKEAETCWFWIELNASLVTLLTIKVPPIGFLTNQWPQKTSLNTRLKTRTQTVERQDSIYYILNEHRCPYYINTSVLLLYKHRGGGAIVGGGALVLSWWCVQGAWATADGLRQKCRIASRSSLPRPEDGICGIFQGFWWRRCWHIWKDKATVSTRSALIGWQLRDIINKSKMTSDSFYSVAVMGSMTKEKQNLHREVRAHSDRSIFFISKPKFRRGRLVVVGGTSGSDAAAVRLVGSPMQERPVGLRHRHLLWPADEIALLFVRDGPTLLGLTQLLQAVVETLRRRSEVRAAAKRPVLMLPPGSRAHLELVFDDLSLFVLQLQEEELVLLQTSKEDSPL